MAEVEIIENIAKNPELNPAGMQKMYLSGPMTGKDDWNHSEFHRVAAEFRLAGFEVCNPAEFFDGDTERSRSEYMREAFKYLLEADTIVLLPDWQESEGSRIEAAVAKELDLIIVEYFENEEASQEFHKYVGSLTPVDEDGNPVGQSLGEFKAVESPADDSDGEDG
jgi:hypothetical protein